MNFFSEAHARFFQALASPVRFSVLRLLRAGPHTVSSLAGALAVEQSLLSHHLACLARCGFVSASRQGRTRLYALNPELAPLLDAMEHHLALYARHLSRCRTLAARTPATAGPRASARRASSRALRSTEKVAA